MKKQTRAQKYNDLANAYHQIRSGEPVKRVGAKDGSIRTHPVVPVPDLPEREVLVECLRWLRLNHIFHNRHDCGSGDIAGYGWATYGIKGAGDIIGIVGEHGTHLEIECKRGRGGRLSPIQQKRQKDVNRAGGAYFVVHGWQELEYFMEGLI